MNLNDDNQNARLTDYNREWRGEVGRQQESNQDMRAMADPEQTPTGKRTAPTAEVANGC